MLAFAASPIASAPWDQHRPVASSPLSSSPMRASSPSSLAERGTSAPRQVQSSPIQASKFKFASRSVRSNPLLRKREDAQDSRRRTFLHNVRRNAEDHAWQRRDIEGQYLKNSLLADMGRLSYDAPSFSEVDLEDAIGFQQQQTQKNESDEQQTPASGCDDVMADFAGLEEEELNALVESYEEQQAHDAHGPVSQTISDDEYDDLFAELWAHEESLASSGQPPWSAEQMDIT